MPDDALASVQDQHHQRFFHRVIPVSLRDVVAPVLSYQLRLIHHFTYRLTLSDQHHFEFMWCVRFHIKRKIRTLNEEHPARLIEVLTLNRELVLGNKPMNLAFR